MNLKFKKGDNMKNQITIIKNVCLLASLPKHFQSHSVSLLIRQDILQQSLSDEVIVENNSLNFIITISP